MNKLTWGLSILTALAFTASGGMKLVTDPSKMRADPKQGWTVAIRDTQSPVAAIVLVLFAVTIATLRLRKV